MFTGRAVRYRFGKLAIWHMSSCMSIMKVDHWLSAAKMHCKLHDHFMKTYYLGTRLHGLFCFFRGWIHTLYLAGFDKNTKIQCTSPPQHLCDDGWQHHSPPPPPPPQMPPQHAAPSECIAPTACVVGLVVQGIKISSVTEDVYGVNMSPIPQILIGWCVDLWCSPDWWWDNTIIEPLLIKMSMEQQCSDDASPIVH